MRMLVLLISLFFLSRCSGSSCDEFTVGSCNPDPSDTILALDLPNSGGQWELCNDLCSAKLLCTYWSLSCTNTSCLCSLLKYSYLHSCEVVGGGLGTDVEVVVLKKRQNTFTMHQIISKPDISRKTFLRYAWNRDLEIVGILWTRIASSKARRSGQRRFISKTKKLKIY